MVSSICFVVRSPFQFATGAMLRWLLLLLMMCDLWTVYSAGSENVNINLQPRNMINAGKKKSVCIKLWGMFILSILHNGGYSKYLLEGDLVLRKNIKKLFWSHIALMEPLQEEPRTCITRPTPPTVGIEVKSNRDFFFLCFLSRDWWNLIDIEFESNKEPKFNTALARPFSSAVENIFMFWQL